MVKGHCGLKNRVLGQNSSNHLLTLTKYTWLIWVNSVSLHYTHDASLVRCGCKLLLQRLVGGNIQLWRDLVPSVFSTDPWVLTFPLWSLSGHVLIKYTHNKFHLGKKASCSYLNAFGPGHRFLLDRTFSSDLQSSRAFPVLFTETLTGTEKDPVRSQFPAEDGLPWK